MLTLSSYCFDGDDVHDGYPVACRFTFHRPARSLPTTRFTGTLLVFLTKSRVMIGCVCTYHESCKSLVTKGCRVS